MSICLHRRCTQPANPSHTPAVGQLDGLKQQTVAWRCAVAAQLSICKVKVKVKCTLVQALRLWTGRTAHRGRRGIVVPFLDHGTRLGWGVNVTPRPLFGPRKESVLIVQEAGRAPGPVWTGAENLAPTKIRSPDRPARSQSLYRLTGSGSIFTLFVSKWKKGSVISVNSLEGLLYVQIASIFKTCILIVESILGFVYFPKKQRVFLKQMDLRKGTQCVFCKVRTDFF